MIYNLRLFTKPEILKKLDRENLLTLLRKFSDYFNTRNLPFAITETEITDSFDFEKLAQEFSHPVFDGTTNMFDALELIESMAKPRYAPFVLDYLDDALFRKDFEPENAALNNSILVYLNAPTELFRIKESVQIENPQCFTIIKGKKLDTPLPYRDEFASELTRRLDDIYDSKRFGRGIRVKHYTVNDEEYFLIRKGMPHTCQQTVGGDLSTVNVYFRPEAYDVVIYSPAKNELKMSISNARKWMWTVYPITFSEVFFGDEDSFEKKRCISFTRFQELGAKAMECPRGEPITSVVVTEISSKEYLEEDDLVDQSAPGVCLEQTLTNENILLNMHRFKRTLKGLGEIVAMKLVFYFGKIKRTVILRNENDYGFKLDAKGLLIEKWLYEHGFIINA